MAQGEPGRITGHTLYGFAGTPATLCMDLQELRPLSLICCTDLQELWPHSLWICQNSVHTLYGFAGTPAALSHFLYIFAGTPAILCHFLYTPFPNKSSEMFGIPYTLRTL